MKLCNFYKIFFFKDQNCLSSLIILYKFVKYTIFVTNNKVLISVQVCNLSSHLIGLINTNIADLILKKIYIFIEN